MRLFAERGYHATTLSDVAREVGATKGLIYHYVNSKAELAGQSILAGFWTLKLLEEITATDLAASEKLRRAVESFGRSILFDYQRYQVIFANRAEVIPEVDALIGDEHRRLRSRFFRLYVSIISEGIANGEFAALEPRLAAHTVIEGIFGLAYWSDRSSIPPEQILRQVTEMLVRAVCVNPQSEYCPSPQALVEHETSRLGSAQQPNRIRTGVSVDS